MTNNELLRIAVLGALKVLPRGGIIASVGGLFWPEAKDPLWPQVEAQVLQRIDAAIIKQDLDDIRTYTRTIQSLFQTFRSTSDAHEKGRVLDAMVPTIEQLIAALEEKTNARHLMPLAVAGGCLAMAILYERAVYSSVYYSTDEAVRRTAPATMYQRYKDYFLKNYPLWLQWRQGKFRGGSDSTWQAGFIYTGEVIDEVTGAQFRYSDRGGLVDQDDYFKKLVESIKARIVNDEVFAMAQSIAPIYAARRLIPGQEQQPAECFLSALSHVDVGPYAQVTLAECPTPLVDPDGSALFNDAGYWVRQQGIIFDNQYDAGRAVVTRISLRVESDRISGLQLHGSEASGTLVGEAPNRDIFAGNDRYFTGVRLSFDDQVLRNLRFYFSDGTATAILGAADGPYVVERRVDDKTGYRLTYAFATRLISLSGDKGSGLMHIKFGFDYYPTLPPWLDAQVPKVSILSRANGARIAEQGGVLSTEGGHALDHRTQFLLESLDGDKIRLRNPHTQKLWQASGGGGSEVYSSSPNPGAWEMFHVEWSGADGSMHLRTASGQHFLQANLQQGGRIAARATQALSWEKFHLQLRNTAAFEWAKSKNWLGSMAISALIGLQWVGDGRFLENRGGTLSISSTDLTDQAIFEMQFWGSDTCFLYSPAGSRYLIVEGDRVSATSNNRGDWEKFRYVRWDGFIAFQAHTGKWLCVRTIDNQQVLTATGTEPYASLPTSFGFRVI